MRIAILHFLTFIGLVVMAGCVGTTPLPNYPEAHPPVGEQPRRPAGYIPFQYPYTPEQLLLSDTPRVLAFADKSWQEINQVNASGPFKPDWTSLGRHACPEWFQDAKLGLFIDWGPWSVAGYADPGAGAIYPDWYENRMYNSLRGYHEKTWGKDITDDDLINLMRADDFDPAKFVQLARDSGMKYVVPFLKHHGGFCLWASSVTHRNSMEIGMKRDFATELARACHEKGLKFGVYVSLGEWAYPIIQNGKLVVAGFDGKVHGPLNPKAPFLMGKTPVNDYAHDYLVPQIKELIDKTSPDILWYDGEWEAPAETWLAPEINAYFYTRAAARGQPVAINDRSGKGTRGEQGGRGKSDFMTSEYHSLKPTEGMIWEENRSISHSFGYNWTEVHDESTVLSEPALINLFVDIVSRGGNLLLMVSPDGSGRIPPNQEQRMRALGAWLKVNGEAIYGTRPCKLAPQKDVVFTRSKDGKYVYAISTQWPGETLRLKGVQAEAGAELRMLGARKTLRWSQDDQRLTVTLPEPMADPPARPCQDAWVIRIPCGRK